MNLMEACLELHERQDPDNLEPLLQQAGPLLILIFINDLFQRIYDSKSEIITNIVVRSKVLGIL